MANFIIIVFCLLSGYILRISKVVKPDGFKAINSWIIYIGLPATSFYYLPDLKWDHTLSLCVILPCFILLGAIVFIKGVGKLLQLSRRTTYTLMLVSGFSNTSFVGFPLVASYFGEEYIKWAIISDQTTFFLLASVGTVIALQGSGGARSSVPVSYILRRVLTFPPFVGSVLALSLSSVVDFSGLQPLFAQLSATVSPLALFSIGMQLSFNFYRSEVAVMALSLLYKLCLGPGTLILATYLLGYSGRIAQVANFEMAMPTLVSTSLLLQEFRLNAKLGNSVIGMSIIVGLFSTWLAYQLIHVLL